MGKVKYEGKVASKVTSPTGNNGSPLNQPGAQTAPSQQKVTIDSLAAACKAGGMVATTGPDVCLWVPPGAPAPIPFPGPTVAEVKKAKSGTCSKKVKIKNKAPLRKGSEIPASKGHPPGHQQKGVVSHKCNGPVKFKG